MHMFAGWIAATAVAQGSADKIEPRLTWAAWSMPGPRRDDLHGELRVILSAAYRDLRQHIYGVCYVAYEGSGTCKPLLPHIFLNTIPESSIPIQSRSAHHNLVLSSRAEKGRLHNSVCLASSSATSEARGFAHFRHTVLRYRMTWLCVLVFILLMELWVVYDHQPTEHALPGDRNLPKPLSSTVAYGQTVCYLISCL